MMHRLAAIWCICFANMMLLHCVPQWCDVCQKMWRSHTSLGVAVIIGRSPASFAKGKHHSKNAPLSVDKSAFFVGGSGWIRTTEVTDNRFTVCPLWPLGNAPILELVIGVEPTTCWLQISCSAIEPHQHLISLPDYPQRLVLYHITFILSIAIFKKISNIFNLFRI